MKTRVQTLIGIAVMLFLSSLGGGTALADPSRESVERRLAGYEATGTVADLVKLGPGLDRVLVMIATDARTLPLRRARALFALGFVPSVAGRDLLRQTARDLRTATEGADEIDLLACARALGKFGPEAGPDLLPLVAHPSADIREAAATSLAETGWPLARAPLAQRLLVERDPRVLASLTRALQHLDAATR